MLEVAVARAGEEGDAVAGAQREVAVAAREICFAKWRDAKLYLTRLNSFSTNPREGGLY